MSGIRRFFVSQISVGACVLMGEEYNHAVNVLRLKQGDSVILCDNSGMDYPAEIVRIEKKQMLLSVQEGQPNECEAKTEIVLCCGFLKGDKTEWVVQKATELGVKTVVLFDSAYSSAYISENKLDRMKRVGEEAAKQCGRATYPEIVSLPLKQALETYRDYPTKIFACEFEEKEKIDLTTLKGPVVAVIGSEGGFSSEERETALSLGYCSVTMGKRILRAETAAVSMLSVITYGLGEWSR